MTYGELCVARASELGSLLVWVEDKINFIGGSEPLSSQAFQEVQREICERLSKLRGEDDGLNSHELRYGDEIVRLMKEIPPTDPTLLEKLKARIK